MNQIKKYTMFFIMLIHGIASAQGVVSILDKQTNPGEVLTEFDNRKIETTGTYYLQENWEKGDIYLKSGSIIRQQLLKYDLEDDLLEVKTEDHIKIVPLRLMDSFVLHESDLASRKFINCDNYSYSNGIPISGICQQLDSMRYGLLVQYNAAIKNATYVPSLDMGTKSDKIYTDELIFLTINGIAYQLPNTKKQFLEIYDSIAPDLNDFIKSNHLKFKKTQDLNVINEYLNKGQR